MKDVTIKRFVIFLVLVFCLTYVFEFLVVTPMAKESGYGYAMNPQVKGLVALAMFFPAIGAVLTRLITKEAFHNAMIRPNFKGNVKHYVFAWIGPQVLSIIGAVLYFFVFPERFDPNHGYMYELYTSMGAEMSPERMQKTMILQFVMAFLVAPILNFVTCFGEEWGWRGYMMPKMLEKMKFLPAVLLGGVIWGLWHAPIIALGHNYGTSYVGAPWLGILMMCIFCIVLGIIFTYWTVKTGSILPAVIGHGAVNGFFGAPLFFVADNSHTLLGPTACGIIAMLPLIVVAIIMCVKQTKAQTVENV